MARRRGRRAGLRRSPSRRGWSGRGAVRRSASLASSAARRRARSDRSPSARACRRQAMRLTSQALLLALGVLAEDLGVACPQFAGRQALQGGELRG